MWVLPTEVSRFKEEAMKYHRQALRIRIMCIMPAVAMLLFFMPATQANPMHTGMSRHGHYSHMLRPHNAAAHFLGMTKLLHLTDKQTSRLTVLRNTWIDKNSVNEARLTAAHSDLRRLIKADSIDLKAVDQTLARIGSLESGLWRAFARQLHDIKSMLSARQKQQLAEMHRQMSGRGMRGGFHRGK